jgi:hypothetical protein
MKNSKIMISMPDSSERSFVEAVINFHRPARPGEPPVVLDQDDPAMTTLDVAPRRIRIRNARANGFAPSLSTTGFEIVTHKTKMADFQDRRQVEEIYFPEVARLMKSVTGAGDVLIFGEVLRSTSDEIRDRTRVIPENERRDRTRQGVSASAHVDYDRASTEAYVADIVGTDKARRLLGRPFQLINLWRGVERVERSPLAVCDGSTIAPTDLVPWEIRRPVGPRLVLARTGYQIGYSDGQRWYYYPRMAPDEVLLFKLCDSDPAAVQHVAHSAFADPTTAPDAPPRVSFELRTICFF